MGFIYRCVVNYIIEEGKASQCLINKPYQYRTVMSLISVVKQISNHQRKLIL